jgi:hypothetical protein
VKYPIVVPPWWLIIDDDGTENSVRNLDGDLYVGLLVHALFLVVLTYVVAFLVYEGEENMVWYGVLSQFTPIHMVISRMLVLEP